MEIKSNDSLGGGLQGVQAAQDLCEVASHGHGVGHGQLQLLVGADDEHGAHGGAVRGRAAVGQVGLCGEHVEGL
jgi:hypothetical protein